VLHSARVESGSWSGHVAIPGSRCPAPQRLSTGSQTVRPSVCFAWPAPYHLRRTGPDRPQGTRVPGISDSSLAGAVANDMFRLQHITKSLTIENVPYEVFSTFSATFETVRKVRAGSVSV